MDSESAQVTNFTENHNESADHQLGKYLKVKENLFKTTILLSTLTFQIYNDYSNVNSEK